MTPTDRHRVRPGTRVNLSKFDPDDTHPFRDKADAAEATEENLKRMRGLQEVLYAQAKHALLIVFQGMDCSGKDGAIKHVFSGVNPQGCAVHSFKVPSHLEASHDFLWRHHLATPPRGMIGIFNRSHYESVLVERVHDLVPKKVWRARYDHINNWERMLAAEGTTIVKFFLHISKREQKQRLEDRLADKDKWWKFDPNDLSERKRWPQYQAAYRDALEHCSTPHAPWYVIPADHKWYRNFAVSEVLVRTMAAMPLKFPKPESDLSHVRVE